MMAIAKTTGVTASKVVPRTRTSGRGYVLLAVMTSAGFLTLSTPVATAAGTAVTASAAAAAAAVGGQREFGESGTSGARRADFMRYLAAVPARKTLEERANLSEPHLHHLQNAGPPSNRERASQWDRNGRIFRKMLGEMQLRRALYPAEPRAEVVHQLNTYPSCEGPSDVTEWQPNGRHVFQFFFPNFPTPFTTSLPTAQSVTLYLRLKGPGVWRLQKPSTPSASQAGATPNDVDTEPLPAHLDGNAQNYVLIRIQQPNCRSVLCQMDAFVDMTNSYPYAKIHLKRFALRWLVTTDDQPQRLELRAIDPRTNESLDIGDLFVGMRCDSSEKRLSLPNELSSDSSDLEYLQGLSDSFISLTYTSNRLPVTRTYITKTGLNLRDLTQPQVAASVIRRARLAPGSHHHRGHGHVGSSSGQRRAGGRLSPAASRILEWPLSAVSDRDGDAEATRTMRCEKRRQYVTFASAGMPTVLEPAGFTFISCRCTRICGESDDATAATAAAADHDEGNSSGGPCLPCETRVLATRTLSVKELVDGELVTRHRTIPTDCGCN